MICAVLCLDVHQMFDACMFLQVAPYSHILSANVFLSIIMWMNNLIRRYEMVLPAIDFRKKMI